MTSSNRILLPLICAMASFGVCGAQIPVSFSYVFSPTVISNDAVADIYTADLNNDGIPDMIQNVGNSPAMFAVSIGIGDGAFKTPVDYDYPEGASAMPRAAITSGDFDGDGNNDLVAAMIGTKTVAVYRGNGDGTLKSPIIYTLEVPFGLPDTINACQVAAADFNKDGKLDLVVAAGGSLYILPGNGDGTFAATKLLWFTLRGPGTIYGLVTGDFDGDGNADVAVSYPCNNPQAGCIDLQVLAFVLGDGNFGFHKTGVLSEADYLDVFILGAADVNSDGRSDLIAISNGTTRHLRVWLGQPEGNFEEHSAVLSDATVYGYVNGPFSSPFTRLAPQIVFGDFNDDGQMDFAISAWSTPRPDYPGYHFSPYFFLGTTSSGVFTTQDLGTPFTSGFSNLVSGLFNADGKPDVALLRYYFLFEDNGYKDVIVAELNDTSHGVWSNCPYPLQGRGINLCAPTSSSEGAITSPVDFNATANSFGQTKEMELWVDGKRVTTQYNAWEKYAFLHSSETLAAGAHHGTVLERDIDSTEQQFDFDFTVGPASCIPPTTYGVRICSVVNSSSGVVVQAAATVSGTLARIEVWERDRKIYTKQDPNNLLVSLDLSAGPHYLIVLAVNSDGMIWSQAADVTVP